MKNMLVCCLKTQEKMDILAAEMGEYMDERIRNRK